MENESQNYLMDCHLRGNHEIKCNPKSIQLEYRFRNKYNASKIVRIMLLIYKNKNLMRKDTYGQRS